MNATVGINGNHILDFGMPFGGGGHPGSVASLGRKGSTPAPGR